MNVAEVLEVEAFKSGSDLWVIKNDPNNKWWKEIDFSSGFLLSHCLYHHKKNTPQKLTDLLELTDIKKLEFVEDPNCLLIGSSDHFLNKWILIWNSDTQKVSEKVLEIIKAQKTNSIRFFSDSEAIMEHIETRPKTSLIDITFIENT